MAIVEYFSSKYVFDIIIDKVNKVIWCFPCQAVTVKDLQTRPQVYNHQDPMIPGFLLMPHEHIVAILADVQRKD